ncbi:hypothetical protein [Hoeflea sp.]|uniref:hypothetical protein n=1 Tax=Hoeflea sp. TaxID=1940281 RepID=UPI003B524D7D
MLTVGAKRSFGPILDAMIVGILQALFQVGLVLAILHILPAWAGTAAMIAAALFLAVAGLSRYFADPKPGSDKPDAGLPSPLAGPENWGAAVFLAGAASSGALTLAAAFAGLTLLSAFAMAVWAVAGWSGCADLESGWHRRHLDWGFGLLMFIAATTAVLAGG